MREKLNSNPLAQIAVVGVLLIATGFFVLSSMGGGKEKESGGGATSEATASAGVAAVQPAPGALAAAAPPPPRPVTAAFAAGRTVVLLFVHDGGIDDRMVTAATRRLSSLPGVATFVIPAHSIARYTTIAQGVNVNRVPALVVVRPRKLDSGIPTASVSYGYQSFENVVQAVVDAGYKGPRVDYHP